MPGAGDCGRYVAGVAAQQIEYRRLLPGEFDAAAQLIAEGLSGYREFAHPGWRPPGRPRGAADAADVGGR